MSDATSAVTNSKPSLWIVEDDLRFARHLAELINTSDAFSCDGVYGDCETAIAALDAEIPPDILLMDIGLPGMSGIDGVARTKELSPATQVVMLTVFEDSDKIVGAIAAGASGYLLKGSTLESAVEALKSILSGGAPISPQVAKKVLGLFAKTASHGNAYHLTSREREVLSFLTEGLTKQQIADRLFVSYHTIDKHLRNIYGKMQVRTRGAAVAKALKEHLL